MVGDGVLNRGAMISVLRENSVLAPQGERHQRPIVAELLLTALIDAFSILVIFLLMSFSSAGEILTIGKGTELPKANLAAALEVHPVVKLEEGKIFLDAKEVGADGLVAALLEVRDVFLRQAPQGTEFPGILTVQADRRVKYEVLNSIVLASSQAGFSDIKFAVLLK